MRGASTLIPARFLTLVSHLCVLITLLWENQRSATYCLPTQFHSQYLQIYQRRLIAGFSTGIALLLVELVTFILGLTMFAPTASLISISCHGFASIALTYFVLDSWLCDWYWPLFAFCSVLPAVVDIAAAGKTSNEHQQLTHSHSYKGSWSRWLVWAGVVTTLGSSLPVGFHIGVVNTPAELIKAFCNESFVSRYDLPLDKTWLSVLWSCVVSIFIVGGCTGSVLGAVLANTLGRRKATIVTSLLSLVGALMFVFCRAANSVEMLILGRLIVGLSGGLTTSIVPMYLSELAPPNLSGAMGVACPMGVNVGLLVGLLYCVCRTDEKYSINLAKLLQAMPLLTGSNVGACDSEESRTRLTTSIVPMYLSELAPPNLSGAMGVACPMGVNVGVLVGQLMGLKSILGRDDDWPYLLSVYALLVIICLPVLFMLPESPKYLFVVKRNEQKALKELSRLRGVSASLLTDDISQLREEVSTAVAQASSAQQWTLMSVLADRRLRLPLLLVCSMQAGQQTSGINAVFYYSHTIFKQAGLSELSAQYATIGCGAINVGTAILMVWLLPRVGRRPLLLGSVFASAVILAALAATMNYMHVPGMSYVCMAMVLAYVLAYGFGLGPIPYFIASEMFEVGPRPAGMAWGSLANWGGNFLIGMCFPLMKDSMGPYSFLVFALITAALFVFQKWYFPETAGKSPSKVALLCSRGFSSRPTQTYDANGPNV